MKKDSTLGDLARKLKQSRERDLKQVQQIESEKLSELRERFNELLARELSTIEVAMRSIESEVEDHRSEISRKISKLGGLKIFYVWVTPLLLLLALVGGAAGGWHLYRWLMPQIEKKWVVPQQMRRQDADGIYIRVPSNQIFSEDGGNMKWVKIRGGK